MTPSCNSSTHGSPPRLWGIPTAAPRTLTTERFTPTPVGNTQLWTPSRRAVTVHPHACGEYAGTICRSPARSGSPPRLWGIRRWRRKSGGRWRFTPTPVGNTPCSASCRRRCAVHPHACGEYDAGHVVPLAVDGSPPRLWGIHVFIVVGRQRYRFTPTPVGNTGRRPAVAGAWSVHPHACGEYPDLSPGALRNTGSPPRLWGIHCATITVASR